MKNGTLTIFRKELARFFRDRRMVLGTALLPGILIFALYSFMGTALTSQFSVDDGFVPKVQAAALPDSIAGLAGQLGLEITPADDTEAAMELVREQELDALMVFPEDFDRRVAAYDTASGEAAPAAAIYYNSASTDSAAAYQQLTALLDSYETSLSNKFDVNPGEADYDLAGEGRETSFLASMLPMLLMIFLYSGCLAVAPESIAGEKERGTIATLLITPLKRSHLALGKICALSVIALLAGASSTIGTLLSMPSLMQLDGQVGAVYGPAHYLALAAVILVTVLLIVTCISLLSAFARTVKEAQTYVTPLMVVIMLVGITAMFGNGPAEDWWSYLIPFYNSVQSMAAIFALKLDWRHLLLTAASCLACTGLGVWGLTRMFSSERLMFQR